MKPQSASAGKVNKKQPKEKMFDEKEFRDITDFHNKDIYVRPGRRKRKNA